jgi:uncharacterized protein involved in exopolysaccharide biosynthesis
MNEKNWLNVLRRQGLTFTLALLAGLLLTALVILFAPRKYQSEARLLVRLGRENVSLDPTVTTAGETMSFQQTRDSDVNTLLEAMNSRTVLEHVIDRAGDSAILKGTHVADNAGSGGGMLGSLKSMVGGWLASIDPMSDRERAVIELQKNLNIEAGRSSNVVKVRYRTKNAEFAQQVTQAWVEAYRNEHAAMYSTRDSLKFFENQEVALERELQTARDRLRQTKSEYGIVTIAGKQTDLQSQLQWAHGVVVRSQSALASSKAKLESFTRLRSETLETVVTSEIKTDNNDAQNQMRNRLYDLEIEERRLASIYTTDHPAYRVIAKQLTDARKVLDSQQHDSGEITQGLNPLYTLLMEQWSQAVTEVAQHEAELSAAESILKQLHTQLNALNDQEAEVAIAERDVAVLEEQYRSQYQKRVQARLAAEMETSQLSNLNVIQPASLQHRPVTPNKKICGLLGVAGSLFAACGIVILRESRVVSPDFTQGKARYETGRSDAATHASASDLVGDSDVNHGNRQARTDNVIVHLNGSHVEQEGMSAAQPPHRPAGLLS